MFLNNADASRVSRAYLRSFSFDFRFPRWDGVFSETGWSHLSDEAALPAPEASLLGSGPRRCAAAGSSRGRARGTRCLHH